MPERIFNPKRGTYQSGPIKLIGNLHWDNWRLRLIMDRPEYYLYNDKICEDFSKWINLPNHGWIEAHEPKTVKLAERKWKRQTLMYKLIPTFNLVLATLPIQLILIPMKIMVITW